MAPSHRHERLLARAPESSPFAITEGVLSLVVIAKNEEDRLEACLRSVPIADEILVLDSGSVDRTPAVARACGANVVHTDWPGHVAQKNRALESASGDWILSLDADERLSGQALSEVNRVIRDAESEPVAGYSFPRCSHWCGQPIRHGRWYPDRKVRLVKRNRGRWGGLNPHDQLFVDGAVKPLSGDILHWPYRSLDEHYATIDHYADISARALHEAGRRGAWWQPWVRPPLHFVDAYVWRRGFMDGRAGLTLARLGARHVWMKYRRLRELERS